MIPLALVLALAAAAEQQGTAPGDSRNVRICGTVIDYTSAPPCDLRLLAVDASRNPMEITIRTAARPPQAMRPWNLIGGEVCGVGRVRTVSGRTVMEVEAPAGFEVVKPSSQPPFGEDALMTCEAGLTAPLVLSDKKPEYTSEAMRARVEGLVEMEAVVDATGRVGNVRIRKPLDPGLDQKAVEAMKQWRFKPGTLNGSPVPVLVIVEMTFHLRKAP